MDGSVHGHRSVNTNDISWMLSLNNKNETKEALKWLAENTRIVVFYVRMGFNMWKSCYGLVQVMD